MLPIDSTINLAASYMYSHCRQISVADMCKNHTPMAAKFGYKTFKTHHLDFTCFATKMV